MIGSVTQYIVLLPAHAQAGTSSQAEVTSFRNILHKQVLPDNKCLQHCTMQFIVLMCQYE